LSKPTTTYEIHEHITVVFPADADPEEKRRHIMELAKDYELTYAGPTDNGHGGLTGEHMFKGHCKVKAGKWKYKERK